MEKREINGQTYSRESFSRYKMRAKVEFETVDDTIGIDIYTTEEDFEKVRDAITSMKTDKVISFNIVHWTTRESDDLSSQLVDSVLN